MRRYSGRIDIIEGDGISSKQTYVGSSIADSYTDSRFSYSTRLIALISCFVVMLWQQHAGNGNPLGGNKHVKLLAM